MRRELLISAGPGEWRAALLEDGAPVELRVERGDGAEFGSIHLGRVRRLLPALGAALVDIGGERPAFLPQSETLPRGRRLAEGERVLVQIRREAQGGKAARLTTAIALRGRHVELVAGRPGLAAGAALAAEDRVRLVAIIGAPPGQPALGWRLVDAAPPPAALIGEAAELRRRWDALAAGAAGRDPPARLHPAATSAAALAAIFSGVDRVTADEPASLPEIRAALPQAALAHTPETEWHHDLDALFAEALAPAIALPGGGFVHLEPTRAGVMIDVDSGTPLTGSPPQTALAVDLAAAAAIGRQLRLRNLAGGIVVDFVGLDDRGAREQLRAALARALAADPGEPRVLGWTRLGHLEIARPRRTRALADSLLQPAGDGAAVKTAVTLAHEALRAVWRAARAEPGRGWRIAAGPELAAALAGEAADARRALEARLGRAIAVTPDTATGRDRFQIAPL